MLELKLPTPENAAWLKALMELPENAATLGDEALKLDPMLVLEALIVLGCDGIMYAFQQLPQPWFDLGNRCEYEIHAIISPDRRGVDGIKAGKEAISFVFTRGNANRIICRSGRKEVGWMASSIGMSHFMIANGMNWWKADFTSWVCTSDELLAKGLGVAAAMSLPVSDALRVRFLGYIKMMNEAGFVANGVSIYRTYEQIFNLWPVSYKDGLWTIHADDKDIIVGGIPAQQEV